MYVHCLILTSADDLDAGERLVGVFSSKDLAEQARSALLVSTDICWDDEVGWMLVCKSMRLDQSVEELEESEVWDA